MHNEELDSAIAARLRAPQAEPPVAARAREPLAGRVVFASPEAQAQLGTELLGEGALLVTVPPPTHDARGRLGALLEELVERELARHGAPSPYLAAWSAMPDEAEARLADQLFRARTLGATGLAIAMESLRAIAHPALSPDDSATLTWLARATAHAPLVLLVDDADVGALGYGPPVALASLLAAPVASGPAADAEAPRPAGPTDELPRGLPEDEPVELTGDDATIDDRRVAPVEVDRAPTDDEAPLADAAERLPPPDEAPLTEQVPLTDQAPPPSPHATARSAGSSLPWRTWSNALAGARGPQPPSAFERLFVESYAPLANAIARGLDDPRAVRAYEDFRRAFERSYSDAFAAFGATNRRPRLVMDAYDVAMREARLAGARGAQVLVVDSMRFDLGCMVRDGLARELAGVATLTSEALLWSALPTTSTRQLETLARGLDALRDPGHDDELSASLRGRAAEVVRRLRVGSRELFKLDLVPALLDCARAPAEALEGVAGRVAEAIARHVSTLPPHTLLLVVGDHGFTLDRRGVVRAGGASPEEVLVPAFTWLVGELN